MNILAQQTKTVKNDGKEVKQQRKENGSHQYQKKHDCYIFTFYYCKFFMEVLIDSKR